MTTLAWRMIAFGLLCWTSSSAERNNDVKTNEITDNGNYADTTSRFKIVDSPLPYDYDGKTTNLVINDDDRSHLHVQFHVSSSPAGRIASSPTNNEYRTSTPDDDRIPARDKRDVDRDSFIDLIEPKNDIEIETSKHLTNDAVLETAREISGYYGQIKPTKTNFITKPNQRNDDDSDADDDSDDERRDGAQDVSHSDSIAFTKSGEEERASLRGRSLMKPVTAKSDTNASNASSATLSARSSSSSSSSDDRKTNSDIQEIINGFVKLLNGNVQVQVNTNGQAGKPSFPSRTRINNRGPPRITDVPPIVFEAPNLPPPAANPPQSSFSSNGGGGIRDPPPYPFDVPQSLPSQPPMVLRPFVAGVPVPEQIVPSNSTNSTADHHLAEPDKDKTPPMFHFVSNSSVEKVNRTHIKVTPPNLSVVSSTMLPVSSTAGGDGDSRLKENGSKNETNKLNGPASTAANEAKNPSVDIKSTPSASSAASLAPSVPPILKPELSDGFLPSTGVGTAVVVLEPSTQEVSILQETHKATSIVSGASSTMSIASTALRKRPQSYPNNTSGYFPRPGIVLDDPEYKPGTHRRPPPPIITSAPVKTAGRDTFDVTVSAIQGPGGSDGEGNSSKGGHPYVHSELDAAGSNEAAAHSEMSIITNPQSGQNFVSIDGKRTYLNLFDSSSTSAATAQITPTIVKNYPGTPAGSYSASQAIQTSTTKSPPSTKTPPLWKKPTHPPVRIDTCIVGDDSTCDSSQHERCRTEVGVSSCHCRPGYTRRKHREPCHRVVSLFLSLRVDRMYDQHLSWNDKFAENDTAEYQQLEYEAGKAIDSALSMTPFSDLFLGSRVNNIYTSRNSNIASPVFVNMTIQLAESQETLRTPVKQDLQKHLMGVIQRRSNNIGSSALWVDNPAGVVSQIHDVDECSSAELNDCHSAGKCTNVFGSFHCTCPEGYRDPWAGNHHRSGRTCEKCDVSYCNHRGECNFHNGQPVCRCVGSYYGAQCEIDGEVLGVAIGSSLIAILIIITTLACLCAWSRRWNKEQKIGSPIFGYMPSGGSTVKTPVMGGPPYQVSLEDRLRWAQIADAMAHANHYGPEPVNGSTRPSSTIFGYTLPHSAAPIIMPRLRPPSVHTLRTPESSTSEEEDRADLLGRNFQVPRPKSRSSIANQSGIYYDVDYESQQQSGEIFSTIKSGQPPCIPLNTYTMGSRSHYFNFRS